jgi:hypothetical protein
MRKEHPCPADRTSAERGRSIWLGLADELLKTAHFSWWVLMRATHGV